MFLCFHLLLDNTRILPLCGLSFWGGREGRRGGKERGRDGEGEREERKEGGREEEEEWKKQEEGEREDKEKSEKLMYMNNHVHSAPQLETKKEKNREERKKNHTL